MYSCHEIGALFCDVEVLATWCKTIKKKGNANQAAGTSHINPDDQ